MFGRGDSEAGKYTALINRGINPSHNLAACGLAVLQQQK